MKHNIDRKNIWHISSNPWNSAISEYALSTIRSLESMGHKNLFSPLKGSPVEIRAKKYHLNIISFQSFTFFRALSFLVLKYKFQPDYIFVYGGQETFLARILKCFFGTIVLVRFRGQALKGRDLKFKRFLRWSYSHVDYILSPGKSLTEELNKIFNKERVKYIPLGVDTKKFNRKCEEQILNNKKRPEILIVGRLDPVKGHTYFFEIFAQLLRFWPKNSTIPKPKLIVVGQEENVKIETLEKKISDLKICNEDVEFNNQRVEEISLMMSKSTLGIIPSLWSEEICRVAQEFLLCGTAIFVSGVGSLEDCLFEKKCGISYKNKDIDSICKSLTLLICEEYFLSENERYERSQRAKKIFSFDAMSKNLMSIIK